MFSQFLISLTILCTLLQAGARIFQHGSANAIPSRFGGLDGTPSRGLAICTKPPQAQPHQSCTVIPFVAPPLQSTTNRNQKQKKFDITKANIIDVLISLPSDKEPIIWKSNLHHTVKATFLEFAQKVFDEHPNADEFGLATQLQKACQDYQDFYPSAFNIVWNVFVSQSVFFQFWDDSSMTLSELPFVQFKLNGYYFAIISDDPSASLMEIPE